MGGGKEFFKERKRKGKVTKTKAKKGSVPHGSGSEQRVLGRGKGNCL